MQNVDILGLGVRLVGGQDVVRGLQNIQRQANQSATQINSLTRAATGFAAAAGAISIAALRAYDSFARFEMGAKSLLGTLEGQRFAKAIQQFAVPSAFSADILRKGAQGLASTGMSSGKAFDVLKAVTNLAAAGGSTNEELSRTLLALRQIQSKGAARGEEVNQQLAEALPLLIAEVKKISGRDPIGMKSDEFFAAVIQAGQKYESAQSNLAATSPQIAIQNFTEAVNNSLIPTGKLLGAVLAKILQPLNHILDILSQLNEGTNGLLGLTIIGGLVSAVFQNIIAISAVYIKSLTGLNTAELFLVDTTTKLNLAFGLLLKQMPTNILSKITGQNIIDERFNELIEKIRISVLRNRAKVAGMGAGLGQNGAAVASSVIGLKTVKRLSSKYGAFQTIGNSVMNMLSGAGAFIKGSPGMLMNGIKNLVAFAKPFMSIGKILKVGGWTTLIMLAIEVVPRLIANLGKIFGALAKQFGELSNIFGKSEFGQAIMKIGEWIGMLWETIVSILSLDWLVKLMGIEDEVDQGNANAVADAVGNSLSSTRPIRRGDPENWWYSRMAEMAS
jgi:tape measure domain-containing protein